MSLSDAKKGDRFIVTAIHADNILKKRLNTIGIAKNSEIEIDEISLGSSNIKVSVGETNVALRFSEAEKIEVKAL